MMDGIFAPFELEVLVSWVMESVLTGACDKPKSGQNRTAEASSTLLTDIDAHSIGGFRQSADYRMLASRKRPPNAIISWMMPSPLLLRAMAGINEGIP
jgi:hypothetical protein